MAADDVRGDPQPETTAALTGPPPDHFGDGLRKPGAVVEHLDLDGVADVGATNLDHPSTVLDRIGDQVAGCLPEANTIADNHRPLAAPVQAQRGSVDGGRGLPGLDGLGQQLQDIDVLKRPSSRSAV